MTRLAGAALVVFCLALFGAALASVRAAPLVVGLSEDVISIDPRFTGTEVLLFGAADRPGDLVVVLYGPEAPMVVRRKERLAGVWVNRESVVFATVPRFYAISATRPLDEFASPAVLEDKGIGLENLTFLPLSLKPEPVIDRFRAELVQSAQRAGLYQEGIGAVEFMGERLFRAGLKLPANIPTGTYRAEAYLFRGGEIVASEAASLVVRKTGLEAQIVGFAHARPWLYGLLAIAVALMAGWLGSLVFRKAGVR